MTQEPNKQEDQKTGSSKPRFGKKQMVISGIVAVVLGACGLAYALNSADDAKFAVDGSGWAQNRMRQEALEAKEMKTIVRATKDIPEGATIRSEDLEEEEMQATLVPQDALTSPEDAPGKIAKYGISQGQIVSLNDLQPVASTVDNKKESKKHGKHHK